jgi:hypothetical protein
MVSDQAFQEHRYAIYLHLFWQLEPGGVLNIVVVGEAGAVREAIRTAGRKKFRQRPTTAPRSTTAESAVQSTCNDQPLRPPNWPSNSAMVKDATKKRKSLDDDSSQAKKKKSDSDSSSSGPRSLKVSKLVKPQLAPPVVGKFGPARAEKMASNG